MTEKKEDATQTCDKCGTELICKKIIKTWNNKTEEKLQWQNQSNGNPHFMFAGEGKYHCIVPKDDEPNKTSTLDTVAPTISSDGSFTPNVDELDTTAFTVSAAVAPPLPEMDKITEKYVNKQLILIHQIEQKAYKFLGKDARGDKVGMYVKLILEVINRK